jgi:hypothetical protein
MEEALKHDMHRGFYNKLWPHDLYWRNDLVLVKYSQYNKLLAAKVESLFVTTELTLQWRIYNYETQEADVTFNLEEHRFTIISRDQTQIRQLVEAFGKQTLCGLDLLEQLDDADIEEGLLEHEKLSAHVLSKCSTQVTPERLVCHPFDTSKLITPPDDVKGEMWCIVDVKTIPVYTRPSLTKSTNSKFDGFTYLRDNTELVNLLNGDDKTCQRVKEIEAPLTVCEHAKLKLRFTLDGEFVHVSPALALSAIEAFLRAPADKAYYDEIMRLEAQVGHVEKHLWNALSLDITSKWCRGDFLGNRRILKSLSHDIDESWSLESELFNLNMKYALLVDDLKYEPVSEEDDTPTPSTTKKLGVQVEGTHCDIFNLTHPDDELEWESPESVQEEGDTFKTATPEGFRLKESVASGLGLAPSRRYKTIHEEDGTILLTDMNDKCVSLKTGDHVYKVYLVDDSAVDNDAPSKKRSHEKMEDDTPAPKRAKLSENV